MTTQAATRPADLESETGASRAAQPRRRAADWALLSMVVAVTAIVSLPRFHGLMLADDEADARLALVLIGESCDAAAGPADRHELARALATPYLEHRLRDVRIELESGRAQYHGYWIEAWPDADGVQLVAWPRRVGGTGRLAFLRRAGGELFRSRGASPWSGLDQPPDAAALTRVDWQLIGAPSARSRAR